MELDFGPSIIDRAPHEEQKNITSDNNDDAAHFLDFRDADDLSADMNKMHISNPTPITNTNTNKSNLVFIDVISHDNFESSVLSFIHMHKLKLKNSYSDFYDFVCHGDPDDFQLLLDNVENHSDVAEGLHRLRVITGCSQYDTKTNYQFYYLLSFCTDPFYDDWGSLVYLDIKDLFDEFFSSTFYIVSHFNIKLVLLPANLTPFEIAWIQTQRVHGIQLTNNPFIPLDAFLCPDLSLTEEGQNIHLDLIKKFIYSTIVPNLPKLHSWHLSHLSSPDSIVARFNWLYTDINKYLNLIDNETDKEAEILTSYQLPIIC